MNWIPLLFNANISQYRKYLLDLWSLYKLGPIKCSFCIVIQLSNVRDLSVQDRNRCQGINVFIWKIEHEINTAPEFHLHLMLTPQDNEFLLKNGNFSMVKGNLKVSPDQVRRVGLYLVVAIKPGIELVWDQQTSLQVKLSADFQVSGLIWLKLLVLPLKCGIKWKYHIYALIGLLHCRVKCVVCVETMMAAVKMTSPHAPMKWSQMYKNLATAGRYYPPVTTAFRSLTPVCPTPTGRPILRNGVTSSTVPLSRVVIHR